MPLLSPLAAASVVVLLVVAGSYVFAYRLYKSWPLLLIGIGWLLNIAYVLVEVFISYVLPERWGEYGGIIPYLASLPATYFFYFAAHVCQVFRQKHGSSSLGKALLLWTVFIGTFGLVGILGLMQTEPRYAFYVVVAPGVLFSTVALGKLSLEMRKRSARELVGLLRGAARPPGEQVPVAISMAREEEEHVAQRPLEIARLILILTFGFYAGIQIFYLAKPDYGDTSLFVFLFYFALFLKAVHGVSMPLVAYADFREVNEAMRVRSLTEELGVLTASIEHDIRNPLSNIRKEFTLLRGKRQADAYVQDKIKVMEDQVRRIKAAVDVIPAMRETEDFYRKKFLRWNLVDLCRTAATAVKRAQEGRDVRIDLSHSTAEIFVDAYRERLIQAFVNILNNGIEACYEGGVVLRVEVRILKDTKRHRAVVIFRDEGVGIPAEIIREVARPLFSTKMKDGLNRGIGLFTATRFINHHHGTISFESDGRSFTEVNVDLPLSLSQR